MKFHRIKNWCQAATDDIRYPPDRKQVYEELRAHLMDHYDDLVEQGLAPEAAEQMAVAAMGRASEIAPQLAAIHRPFWGYVYSVSKVLLVLALVLTLLSGWYYREQNYISKPDNDQYIETEGINSRQIFYTAPNQTISAEGYTFTLTDAAIRNYVVSPGQEPGYSYDVLQFRIQVTSLLPWVQGCDGLEWMWAVDDLGNYYYSSQEQITNLRQGLSCWGQQTGLFTWTYDFNSMNYVSQDARWIELHYHRSGRDLTFRIDLTGGDAA